MAYARRDFVGAAAATTLASGIGVGDTSISITSSTNWSSATNGVALAVINRGGSTEEKITFAGRSGTTLTTVVRGQDGTSAASHNSGETIELCIGKIDADEANYAVSKTVGLATAVGQIPVVDAANSFAMLQAKASGQILQGNGTTLVSNPVTGDVTIDAAGVTAIGSSKVTSAMIVDATIATGDIANNAVTNTKLAGMTRGKIKVGDSGGAASDLALGTASQFLGTDGTDPSWRSLSGDATLSAGALTIANSAVTTAKINDAAVTNAKLAGMTRGTVKVGNSSGIASDLALGSSAKILQSDGTDAKWNAVSGDVTIDNTGVTAIGSGKILAAMVAAGILTQAMVSTGFRFTYEGTSAPGSPAAGDLWVDTTGSRQALKVYTGAAWVYIGGSSQPLYAARAFDNAGQTIHGNATSQTVALGTESYDYNNNFTANAYTAPLDGLYDIKGGVSAIIADATAQRAYLSVFVGSTERIRGDDVIVRGGTVNDVIGLGVASDLALSAADVVTLKLFGATDGSGDFTLAAGAALTFLSIRRV
jgi:hypothetical protein